jgi:hypothetical protein
MESDALGIREEPKSMDNLITKMTSKRPLLAAAMSPSLTVLVCGLCVLSFTASGYLSYRETLLESRLGALEAQFAVMRATLGGGGGGDVILERIRREVETRVQQRMNREVASGRRLLMDAAASSMQQQLPLHQLTRAPRDVSECVCPPGTKICIMQLSAGSPLSGTGF